MARWFRLGLVGLSLLILKIASQAQNPVFSFDPAPVTDTIPQEILVRLKSIATRDRDENAGSGQRKSFVRELYQLRYETLVKEFNNNEMITAGPLLERVEAVAEKILAGNPQLSRDLILVLHRSEQPNATSYGNGVVAMMLGLLARLESDDQIAFVLCHEIAHEHSVHMKKRILQLADINFDQNLNRELNSIKRSSYNRYTEARELATRINFSLSQHSRGHELEADSLGLLFLLNTPFNPLAALRTMEILDSVDRAKDLIDQDLKKRFDFPQFPFKATWGAYTPSTTWYKKNETVDSLKTHPNCAVRREALARQLERLNILVRPVNQEPYSVAWQAELEMVESHFIGRQYGKALYQSLRLLEMQPNNAYLHAMVGKCFFRLYESQKNHQLGKVLELPHASFPAGYDKLLTFLHKLRLHEMKALAYYYLVNQDEALFEDEHYLYALWLVSPLEFSALDPEKIRQDYYVRYPHGRYKSELKP